MRKLYICIGIKGSGTTSYVQSHLKDGEVSIVVPNIQAIKVFEEGTDVLYIDNDNLKRSARAGLYNYCKHRGIEVIALCFLKPLATLIHNYNKECGKSISDIIQDYKILQVPRIGVDCDKIEKVYDNNFNEFRHEFLGNLPHDNPNHKESINEHIMMCVQNSPTLRLKEISKYHDLGKFICKEFVSEHRATYHNHAFVSAMYYLAKIDVTNQEKLDNLEVIYQHIAVMDGLTDKQIKRNKLEKIVSLMLEFREIDKKSRII